MSLQKLGIVGAGPAGAWLAYKLSQAGFKVLLFDARAPWDKPCAGGLDPLVWSEFPELLPLQEQALANASARVITTRKERIEIELKNPIYTLSRKTLGQFLIERATKAGANFARQKIAGFEPSSQGFELRDDSGEKFSIDFLVGADGAAGVVRNRLCPGWSSRDYCATVSLNLPGRVNLPLTLQYFPGVQGYAWIFPGREQSALGMGVRASTCKAGKIFTYLEQMVSAEPALAQARSRLRAEAKRALIPALRFKALCRQKVVSENWALVGDASGAAHAASGEGIYYALKTASLLAESLFAGEPESYQRKWWHLCKQELLGPSLWSSAFFNQRVQDFLAGKLKQSPSARQVAMELVSCSRPARSELLRLMFKMLFE